MTDSDFEFQQLELWKAHCRKSNLDESLAPELMACSDEIDHKIFEDFESILADLGVSMSAVSERLITDAERELIEAALQYHEATIWIETCGTPMDRARPRFELACQTVFRERHPELVETPEK